MNPGAAADIILYITELHLHRKRDKSSKWAMLLVAGVQEAVISPQWLLSHRNVTFLELRRPLAPSDANLNKLKTTNASDWIHHHHDCGNVWLCLNININDFCKRRTQWTDVLVWWICFQSRDDPGWPIRTLHPTQRRRDILSTTSVPSN